MSQARRTAGSRAAVAAVIEPDAWERERLRHILSSIDWVAETAATLDEGATLCRGPAPGIVFAPAEWIDQIRAMRRDWANLPIIATVRFGDWLRWEEELSGRVLDILAKPFAQSEVAQAAGPATKRASRRAAA